MATIISKNDWTSTDVLTNIELNKYGTDVRSLNTELAGKANTSHTHTMTQLSGTLPVSKGGTGQTSLANVTVGNATQATQATSATQATKLSTARTFTANLDSTTAGSFDGTANVTLGTTGTLPVSKGGTGNTSLTYAGICYGGSGPAIKTTAAGASGDLLMSGGTSAPYFTSPLTNINLVAYTELTDDTASVNFDDLATNYPSDTVFIDNRTTSTATLTNAPGSWQDNPTTYRGYVTTYKNNHDSGTYWYQVAVYRTTDNTAQIRTKVAVREHIAGNWHAWQYLKLYDSEQ